VFPAKPGLDTLACIESAHRGEMDFAVCLGGNLFGSNPDADFAAEAIQKIGTVVHLNTTLNTGHLRARGRETIILPVLARDEDPQSTTQESMFNYVRVSEGGPRRLKGPRSETEVIAAIAEAGLAAETPIDLDEMRTHAGIRRSIAAVVPGYAPVEDIDVGGAEFQIEGRTFHEPKFATPTGRLRIQNVNIPEPAPLGPRQVRVVTVRSEGQFNTVVYEDCDVYRGGAPRSAVLLNAEDMRDWGLTHGDRVEVSTETGSMEAIARPFDIVRGAAAMYFPECNILVPRRVDPESRTPAFKGFVATISGPMGPRS
jgi:anaerobic selenocysteine-containing dehydrogenase